MAKAIQLGEAGVLRVMSELILRGHTPYKPAVDDHGVDLMLSTGVRLQVKTATLRTRRRGTQQLKDGPQIYLSAGYFLSLGWCQMGRVQSPIRRKRLYSQECDYFIIWGVDENRFWIVPSFVLDNRTCLVLGPKPQATSKQVQDLAAKGLGLQEISRTLGICEVTAWKRKKGDAKHGSFVRSVRMCEDKWDFLSGAPQSFLQQERNPLAEVRELEKMLNV